jgi:hypothetical protein
MLSQVSTMWCDRLQQRPLVDLAFYGMYSIHCHLPSPLTVTRNSRCENLGTGNTRAIVKLAFMSTVEPFRGY